MIKNQTRENSIISIHTPEKLDLAGAGGTLYHGGCQMWYSTLRQRRAGCGPTSCSNLFWYLALTHPGCRDFVKNDIQTRTNFTSLMEDVWNYVTPQKRGVNSLEIFTDGAEGYAKLKGIPIKCHKLKFPIIKGERPSTNEVLEFLENAFEKDLPVAFLNLSNGLAKNLDSWHWVTIVAADWMLKTVLIFDQGNTLEINIDVWRSTSFMGGGFVAIEPLAV